MREYDQQQSGRIRFDSPGDDPVEVNLDGDGEGKGGFKQKVFSVIGSIVAGIILIPFLAASDKSDMSDQAREIIEDELAEMEADHPSLYAANEEYVDELLDDVHEEAFQAIYEQAPSSDDFDPNAYFEWVFEELIARAEQDRRWDLADALYEEYEPFEKGYFEFQVSWQPF